MNDSDLLLALALDRQPTGVEMAAACLQLAPVEEQ